MFKRQTQGSVVCPSCGRLVGVRDDRCLICGARNPGMWGFAQALRRLGHDYGISKLIFFACGGLYLISVLLTPDALSPRGGLLSLFSPGRAQLFLFGASGAVPVFMMDRWWTVLSAAWLHGGILHIVFNLMWVRDLVPAVARLLGAGRMLVIWTAGSILGFLASSAAGFYLAGLPRFLVGAGFTVGASAPVFGLLGALICYGQRTGQSGLRKMVWGWVVAGAIFGLVVPGIDNWAHGGGFVGGWLAARWLNPLAEERPVHVLWGLICLVAAGGAIAASIVTGLPYLER